MSNKITSYLEQSFKKIIKPFMYIDILFSMNFLYVYLVLLYISMQLTAIIESFHPPLYNYPPLSLYLVSSLLAFVLNYTLLYSSTIQSAIESPPTKNLDTAKYKDLNEMYDITKKSYRVLYLIPILILLLTVGTHFSLVSSGTENIILFVIALYLRLILIYSLVSLLTIYHRAKEYTE